MPFKCCEECQTKHCDACDAANRELYSAMQSPPTPKLQCWCEPGEDCADCRPIKLIDWDAEIAESLPLKKKTTNFPVTCLSPDPSDAIYTSRCSCNRIIDEIGERVCKLCRESDAQPETDYTVASCLDCPECLCNTDGKTYIKYFKVIQNGNKKERASALKEFLSLFNAPPIDPIIIQRIDPNRMGICKETLCDICMRRPEDMLSFPMHLCQECAEISGALIISAVDMYPLWQKNKSLVDFKCVRCLCHFPNFGESERMLLPRTALCVNCDLVVCTIHNKEKNSKGNCDSCVKVESTKNRRKRKKFLLSDAPEYKKLRKMVLDINNTLPPMNPKCDHCDVDKPCHKVDELDCKDAIHHYIDDDGEAKTLCHTCWSVVFYCDFKCKQCGNMYEELPASAAERGYICSDCFIKQQ